MPTIAGPRSTLACLPLAMALMVAGLALAPGEANAAGKRLRLVAMGDICPWQPQGNLIERDIAHVLGPAARWITRAAIAFANFEAPIVRKGMRPVATTGLPILKARESLPGNLAKAGFDVMSLANNHPFDYGYAGVVSTLKTFAATPIKVTGLGMDKASAERAAIVTRNGIRVAFIAATDRVNRRAPKKPRKPVVAWLRTGRLEAQVRALRKRNHIVAVSLHWGRSYRETPIASQEKIAARLVKAGADVILGGHPHVLQPVVFAPGRRKAVVAYSLGNFLFGGQEGARGRTLVLGIDFVLDKGAKRARVVRVDHLPLVVNRKRLLRPPADAEARTAFATLKQRSPALGWRGR